MTSGFNHAVVEGLPSAADMRTYEQQARLATIADPRLRQEVSDFFSQCYIPARSKYQTECPATAAINTLLATNLIIDMVYAIHRNNYHLDTINFMAWR